MVCQCILQVTFCYYVFGIQSQELEGKGLANSDGRCIRFRLESAQQFLGIFAYATAEIEISGYLSTKLFDRPSTLDALRFIEETGKGVFLSHDFSDMRERQLFYQGFWGCDEFIRRRRMNYIR